MFLLVSSLSGTGGIEHFNRLLTKATAELGMRCDEPVWVASLLDTDDVPPSGLERVPLSIAPARGNRIRFIWSVLLIGIRCRPRVVLAGLLSFGPLAWAMKQLRITSSYAVQIHGTEAWGHLPPHRRYALQHADAVATVSMFSARMSAEANTLDMTKVRLLRPVVDDSWPRNYVETHEQPDADSLEAELLTVARLDALEGKKGIDKVLRALASTELASAPWRYSVVGAGSDLGATARALRGTSASLVECDFSAESAS